MGRAGGGGGGFHGGGGFSGGGRSSGGFSGGGRSGRSSSSSGRSSSYHHSYSPRTVYVHNSYGGGYYRGAPPSERGGCAGVAIIVIIFILLFAMFIIFPMMASGAGVAKSTVEREALPPGVVDETGYYTDQLGWIANSGELTKGMKSFYKETGVQPYLYIVGEVGGNTRPTVYEMEDYSNQLYAGLFNDEAHFLVVFQEANDQYMVGYTVGSQAKTVLDDEAIGIFRDYMDRYYTSDLSDEEYFSTVFAKTGSRIMTVTKSPWPAVLAIFGLIILAVILYNWWLAHTKAKAKKAKQVQDILNTPLDSFGSKGSKEEELAKKYE